MDSVIGVLPFLGFLTTFSSLMDILKYLHFHHFLILAPSVGGVILAMVILQRNKTSLQLKLGLQGTYLSLRDIKNGISSFQARLVRIDKF
jgi:hypothetical protein